MTNALHVDAGQCLLVGFEGTAEVPGDLRTALRTSAVGGVVLFSRNITGDWGELAHLNAAIDACRPADETPVFIAVDQEGGRVRRVKGAGVTPIPPMLAVGRSGDTDLAAKVGEVIASELAALGFNLNFAPVLDVWTNPENRVIGDRAFGTTVEEVSAMAGALTVGHYLAGVCPCGKHFPGHGDTLADSHHELPVLPHDPAALRARELVPFARAIAAGIPMIMTAHILIPALDAVHPVTLSRAGVRRLLREELGYEGVVVSDDLEMKAIADRYEIEEVVALGLAAGVDIFLICHTADLWLRAHAAMVRLGEKESWAREAIGVAAARVRALKSRYLPLGRFVPGDLGAELATAHNLAVVGQVVDAAAQ
jgi:beta-N-acetylhexosaminidase